MLARNAKDFEILFFNYEFTLFFFYAFCAKQ